LLDANVLYPARMRDLLIRLAIAGLYQARWSERIPEGLRVVSPDEFVAQFANDDLDVVVEVVETQAAGLVNPPMTMSQLLDGMEDVGLVESVVLIRAAIS
jgi:hypothetical protein